MAALSHKNILVLYDFGPPSDALHGLGAPEQLPSERPGEADGIGALDASLAFRSRVRSTVMYATVSHALWIPMSTSASAAAPTR